MKRNAMFFGIAAVVSFIAQPAVAANRVQYGDHGSMKTMQQAKTVFDITGASADELQLAGGQKVGSGYFYRFEQYHLGVPVLGGAIAVEIDGSSVEGPVKKISGQLLTGLAQEIRNRVTGIDAVAALDVAKRTMKMSGLGQGPDASNTAHLYVWRDPAGKAKLVYVVTVESANARTTMIVDANTAKVLDKWNSREGLGRMGPGGYLSSAYKALAARGWSRDKIDMLMAHAKNLYQIENDPTANDGCGAMKAANDLGYSMTDVRAAFASGGTCRSNVRRYTLAIESSSGGKAFAAKALTDVVPDIPAEPDYAAAANTTTALAAKTSAWRRLTTDDLNKLANYNTGAKNVSAAYSALGLTSGYRVDTGYLNNILFDSASYGSTSLDYCARSSDCVDIRMKATGTKTAWSSYTNWSKIPGLTAFQFPPTPSSVAVTVPAQQLWSIGKSNESSWSYTVGTEVSVGVTLGFTQLSAGNFNIAFSQSSTKGGGTSITYTNNFSISGYRVPAGCYLKATAVEHWIPLHQNWVIRPEFQGSMEVDVYDSGGNDTYRRYAATAHFTAAKTSKGYTLAMAEKVSPVNSIIVQGIRFSNGTACTLTQI
jgi:hypothetical protein